MVVGGALPRIVGSKRKASVDATRRDATLENVFPVQGKRNIALMYRKCESWPTCLMCAFFSCHFSTVVSAMLRHQSCTMTHDM